MNRRSLLPDLAPAESPPRWRLCLKTRLQRLWHGLFCTTAGALFLSLILSFVLMAAIVHK